MSTQTIELKAICPECRMPVGMRPGMRLLKHGQNALHARLPCLHSGEKVSNADVLAWAREREANAIWSRAQAARVREDAAAALVRAETEEKTAEATLSAAKELVAEYEAKVKS